jgi:hypothetical protein
MLRGHTMDVFPSELSLAWAYHLDWDPIPVLQSYSAYTPWLDQTDARFLNSAQAPSRILLQAGSTSLDFRALSFDEPETSLALFCRYRPLLTTNTYAVLGREPDRCGHQRPIGTQRAGWGQTVQVPLHGRNSLILGRINGVQVGGLESLTALFVDPTERWITLNGGVWAHRLVEGTAGDGLPLNVPAKLDYPKPFSVTQDVNKLAVTKAGQSVRHGGGPPTGPITYSFFAVSIRPWP